MKKLFFVLIVALSLVSCTSDIKSDGVLYPSSLDDATTLLLTNVDKDQLRSCLIVDDKVYIFPNDSNKDLVVMKNYDVAGPIVLSVLVSLVIGAIFGANLDS